VCSLLGGVLAAVRECLHYPDQDRRGVGMAEVADYPVSNSHQALLVEGLKMFCSSAGADYPHFVEVSIRHALAHVALHHD
jgi:hypothetical protein